ncbi:MAG: hypothetical protein ABJZ55_03705 [Fuerstiella sp.]
MSWLALLVGVTLCLPAYGQRDRFDLVRRIDVPEAGQAVAVDDTFFYAISNSVVAKYERQSGQRVAIWKADAQRPLKHLNSGIVIDGKLYCAHSNYPQFPEASSVEVWDTTTLQHVQSKSLGIYEGSLTWIDQHDGDWWAVFAHYSKKVNQNPFAKDHTHTSLVHFDDQWRRKGGYIFPKTVLDRFDPHSCSGGSWGPDGMIYCSGHDLGEIYQLRLPKAGSTLVLEQTLPAPITGQGFAWAPDGQAIYGIDRARRQVVVAKWVKGVR